MSKRQVYACDLCQRELPAHLLSGWYVKELDEFGKTELAFAESSAAFIHTCKGCDKAIITSAARPPEKAEA